MRLRILIPIFTFFTYFMLSSCTSEKNKPNIIFILADDMGYGDVSCLNPDAKLTTPNLDKLAQQGITLTDAHSGAAVCTPTRYGILTGRYCWRSSLKESVLWPWDGALIEEDRLTVADFLKQNGYTTACIGKWHLGWNWSTTDNSKMNDICFQGDYNKKSRVEFGKKVDFSKPVDNGPVTRGFDYYFGDDVPNFPPYCFIENDRVQTIPNAEKPDTVFGFPGPMAEGWKLDAVLPAITQKAIEYIKTRPNDGLFRKQKGKPFFLYFALTAPHTPIAPIKKFQGTSNAGLYGDYVQEVDWVVGKIMETLKDAAIENNTLVIFSSDNGSPGRDGTGMSGELQSATKYGHYPSYIFKGMKADIWEGGHRVPFIARWPEKIKPQTTSNEVICLNDFMATCAAIIGVKLPENSAEDSYNILPVLTGEKHENPIRDATIHHSYYGTFAIRKGKWKLIMSGGSGGWSHPRNDVEAGKQGLPSIQLFDLENDVGETKNVQEEFPGVVEELSALIYKYKKKEPNTMVKENIIDNK